MNIVTSHHDYQDRTPYPGIELNTWQAVGKARVLYMNKLRLDLRSIKGIVASTPHDLIYLNSVFSYRFSILPLLARRLGRLGDRPVLVASRGELGGGALALSRSRKRTYLRLAGRLGLFNGLHWQASSDQEAHEIAEALSVPSERIHVAPNLADLSQATEIDSWQPPSAGCPLSIAFLSRISRKKNLLQALDLVAELARRHDPAPRFHVYGNVCDPAYWRECLERISSLGVDHLVTLHGPLPHQAVRSTLASHDLFLLPTLHENYGHVIMESLAAGTPVLISDQTPWSAVASRGAGWVCGLDDRQAFLDAVQELLSMDPGQRRRQRRSAADLAAERAADPQVLASNRRLFQAVARHG